MISKSCACVEMCYQFFDMRKHQDARVRIHRQRFPHKAGDNDALSRACWHDHNRITSAGAKVVIERVNRFSLIWPQFGHVTLPPQYLPRRKAMA